jgi:hypothetical protein
MENFEHSLQNFIVSEAPFVIFSWKKKFFANWNSRSDATCEALHLCRLSVLAGPFSGEYKKKTDS